MYNLFKIVSALSGLLMLLFATHGYADDDTGLGSASGLAGESTNGAVISAPQSISNIPSNARVPIILPPDSYQPHTLVVPLANEKSPPLLLRRDSTEVLQQNQPALPRNSVNGLQSIDTNPRPTKNKQAPMSGDLQKNQDQFSKTKPLAPIVY